MPEAVNEERLSDYAVGLFEKLPTRKSVKKAIKRGEIKVDQQPGISGLWVKPGMRIEYLPAPANRKIFELPLEIVYEDDFLSVVIKPSGIATSGNQFRTLENALPFTLKPSLRAGAYEFPKPVHRLDRATSGLVLIAKTPKVRAKLGQMLENKSVSKHYLAIVSGCVENKNGTIDKPVDEKPAKTTFKVLRQSTDERYTLLELSPLTGRTHQLRIHCATKGWPILGDRAYGDGKGPGKGLFLCAVALSFQHPETNKPLSLQIDMPRKFVRFIEKRF